MNEAASRSDELASMFATTAEDFACFLESLTLEQWHALVPDEERTVAALARHVGWGFSYEMIAFKAFAAGETFSTVPRAQLNALNAQNGAEYADCPQQETVSFIRTEATVAEDAVRALGSDGLARSGLYVEGMPELTVELLISRVLIGHIVNHKRGICEVLGLPQTDG
jgi:hypothetical protein